jgi:hypothetical protein
VQVLFSVTHWCRHWALLQPCEESTNEMKNACWALETTVMQIFNSYEWRFRNRIE